MTQPTPRLWLTAAACLAALAPWANAQNFFYADQDLILGIRPTASNPSSDTMLVNLGPIFDYYGAEPGSSFPVGNATAINNTYSSLSGLSYSFSAANKTGTGPTPLQSIWVSRARTDLGIQSIPWVNKSSGNLANTASKIATLGNGAATLPAVPGSFGNAIVIGPFDAGKTVSRWVGSNGTGGGAVGNYNGTFQGNVEITSPANFAADAFIRADLYEVTPGAGDSRYIGYFEINGNGTTMFRAAGVAAVPEPGTVVLAVAGLAALALWHRRSSK